MSGDAERALQAGCDEYLTKPVDEGLLFMKIRILIENHDPAPVGKQAE
jgi:DNA-binding response OmpR family regulator